MEVQPGPRRLNNGRLSSADEGVRAAVEMRAFVQEGLADLESGEYEDFTEENLRELFDGVARRGRARLLAEGRK